MFDRLYHKFWYYFLLDLIMMFSYLLLHKEKGVATITLNRPEVFNAFNAELCFELQEALRDVDQDSNVKVVVLTGTGKAFCSGQDLKAALAEKEHSYSAALHERYNPIIRAIRDMPKPVLCRLNGIAAGAGCSLALACDLIIAAEEAALTEIFAQIGLVPDCGSSYFLPRLVGPQKAFELSTMASKVTAAEALKIGMVNKVVPVAALDDTVKTYTDYYIQAPTQAIGLMKKMLNKSLSSSLKEMLDYEAYCQEIAGRSADHQEGIKAFLEKRKPEFKG